VPPESEATYPLILRGGFSGNRAQFVSRANGIQPFFRLGIDVRANDLAYEDDVVAGLGFRFQRAFKIRNGIGEQDRINLFGRGGIAVEFGQFIHVPPRFGAEKQSGFRHLR